MIHINFYSKENCPLCDEALTLVEMLKNDYRHTFKKRDIYSNDEWLERYHLSIPVVNIDGIELNCEEISFESLEAAFTEAHKKHMA